MKNFDTHSPQTERTLMDQRVDSVQAQLGEAMSFLGLSKAWVTDRQIHHQKILLPAWLSHKKLHQQSHPTVSILLSIACKNMCFWGRKNWSLR